jgi:hypothetical protein
MTGHWRNVTNTDQGPLESTADLVQAPDGTLSGTVSTTFGNATITRGSVTGNSYTYTFMLDYGQGPTEVSVSGTLEGNTTKGTVSTGGAAYEMSGTRGGPGAAEEVRQ